jgi:hypothetical protein
MWCTECGAILSDAVASPCLALMCGSCFDVATSDGTAVDFDCVHCGDAHATSECAQATHIQAHMNSHHYRQCKAAARARTENKALREMIDDLRFTSLLAGVDEIRINGQEAARSMADIVHARHAINAALAAGVTSFARIRLADQVKLALGDDWVVTEVPVRLHSVQVPLSGTCISFTVYGSGITATLA